MYDVIDLPLEHDQEGPGANGRVGTVDDPLKGGRKLLRSPTHSTPLVHSWGSRDRSQHSGSASGCPPRRPGRSCRSVQLRQLVSDGAWGTVPEHSLTDRNARGVAGVETSCSHNGVVLAVNAVLGLDSRRRDPLDGGRNEINLEAEVGQRFPRSAPRGSRTFFSTSASR